MKSEKKHDRNHENKMWCLISRRFSVNWKHIKKFQEIDPVGYSKFFEDSNTPKDLPKVQGPDLNMTQSVDEILDSFSTIGIQASVFSQAVAEINRMLYWRLSDEPISKDDPIQDMEQRKRTRCNIYIGQTSIVMTSGLRDIIRFLVQHRLVDAVFTTAGGVEEDLIKCLHPFYVGDFAMEAPDLREQGWNRQGNIISPSGAYKKFHEAALPILDEMLEEKVHLGTNWTPSKLIERLALKIGDESSVCYWAAKNKIPIFSPAIVDGAIGDCLYVHRKGNPGLTLDIIEDHKYLYEMNDKARKVGALIVGGSLSKHMILNLQIPRYGLDYAVYVSTTQEFDASDGGARPDEAKSWGKINLSAKPVKLFAEASLVYPLLIAKTFVPYYQKLKKGEILA